jgi:hypothetical protein
MSLQDSLAESSDRQFSMQQQIIVEQNNTIILFKHQMMILKRKSRLLLGIGILGFGIAVIK